MINQKSKNNIYQKEILFMLCIQVRVGNKTVFIVILDVVGSFSNGVNEFFSAKRGWQFSDLVF